MRMQEHWLVLADFDHLHQVLGGLFDVDEGALGVAEDQEFIVEADIDTRRLDELGIERIDPKSAAGDGFVDRAVRKDHRARALGGVPRPISPLPP